MDSTMSLFGTEFSLFGEDLLFSPTAPVDEEVLIAPQDGFKAVPALPSVLPWQAETSQDVLSDKQASGDLLEDWLDTRIDILDLMSGQDAAINSDPFKDLGFEIPMEDHTGLFALKIEAEKAFLELSTTDFDEQPKVAQQLPSQGSDNVYDQGLGLLELLTSDVSQKQVLGVSDFAGLDLAPGVDTSGPILSPMSPEDVESILSSGPPSPQDHVAEESFESLMSNVMGSDISFNDSSIMEDITSYEEAPQPIDLALLSQMVMSGNHTATEDMSSDMSSDSDSDYKVEASSPRSGRGARTKVKKEASVEVLGKVKDRKLRKKQQNKDAATRYRQKKKLEQDLINNEVALLEDRNNDLKDKVDQMSKEISYLKSLLTDVYKARAKTSKKSK